MQYGKPEVTVHLHTSVAFASCSDCSYILCVGYRMHRIASPNTTPHIILRTKQIAQYSFTEKRLFQQAGKRPVSHFYMIGDNPHSDMQGAINMNECRKTGTLEEVQADQDVHAPWSGVLVRTGVFSDGDDTNSASVVVDDVYDAVDWVLKQHNIDDSASQGAAVGELLTEKET